MAITQRSSNDVATELPSRRNPSRTAQSFSQHASQPDPDSEPGSSSEAAGTASASDNDEADTASDSDLDSDPGPSQRRHARQTASSSALQSTQRRNRPIRGRSRPANKTTSKRPLSKSTPRKTQPQQRSSATALTPTSVRAGNKVRTGRQDSRSRADKTIPSGIIPDWLDPRISYGCWADIFFYAAGGSFDSLATSWLINAATTCKIFSEPAISTLYRCPILRHPAKARRLASLLERPSDETCFNYRIKIESLEIDIQIVPQPILYQLIHPLSRLKEIIIFSTTDQPPYRDLDKNVRWRYPEDVFRALEPATAADESSLDKPFPTCLKSWEWSGKFMGGHVASIANIVKIHQLQPFRQVTRLSLTNFQVPSLRNLRRKAGNDEEELQIYHEDGVVIQDLARAISELKSLKHLVFESSTVMNERLLPLLPKNLVHLELINCWEIKSSDLAPFLQSHGSSLRTLTLLHNQSLNLAFLTDLAESCPNLRELHMNMVYFRHHDSINDSDPMYDYALLPNQVPRWPSSIRVIDLEHIRDWSAETVEMFFQSLVDSAEDLTNLRHLAIKTMLDIPWQTRATMRLQWREKMERVFLRPRDVPRPCSTLEQPTRQKEIQDSRKRKRDHLRTPPSRRSGRIAATDHESSQHRDRASKVSRSILGRPSYRDPDTDEDDFDASEQEEEEQEQEQQEEETRLDGNASPSVVKDGSVNGLAIQGLCNTVSILFDNQKVRELQYGMEDFQSQDDDTEDEWDGDDYDDESVVVFR